MCRQQSAISRELDDGEPRIPGISDLLLIRCRMLLNGGRFENARDGFLLNERERGLAGLTLGMADIILAGDRPPFWHWEGDALVVDGYYLKAEANFISFREGGREGGIKSAKTRKKRRRENLHNALKKSKEDRGKGASPINKEINTPYGSISKGTPTLGAGYASDDDSPDGERATQEDMEAFFKETKGLTDGD